MPETPTTRAARTPTTRTAQRRRRRRRRRAAAVVSVLLVGVLIVGVAGFVRSLSERQASLAAGQAGQAGQAAAAGQGGDAGDASGATTADATPAAPSFDTSEAADKAMTVLARYSDAKRSLEGALYDAAQTLRAATTADAADDALATTKKAEAAVEKDAKKHRAKLASAASATSTQPTGGDVDAQLAYLHAHVFDYNSAEWGDYNDYGGDCTNFASQGLIARGWHTDGTWSSRGAMWTASKPWIATAAMAAYFDALGLTYSTEDDLDRVRVGDVAVFNWGETGASLDHTMTVSRVEYVPGGAPKIFFIGHNPDLEYRELTAALYQEHTDSTVRIYHIP